MFKNKPLIKITAAVFISLLILGATSQRANAWMGGVATATLETVETLILELSDDIGEMADRIGEMADRIGEMADRIVYTEELIGEMADRIVHTEELLIGLVDDQNALSLILSPKEGDVAYSTVPVEIDLSSKDVNYILYISNNSDMSDSTNALVLNNDTSDAWSRVASYATGDKLYIAVKTVDDNSSSNLSNTVMLNLQN